MATRIEGEFRCADSTAAHAKTARAAGLDTELKKKRLALRGSATPDALFDIAAAAIDGSVSIVEDGFERVLGAGWARQRFVTRGEFERVGTTRFTLPGECAHAIAVAPDESKVAVACTRGFAVQVVLFDSAGEVLHIWSARDGESMGIHNQFGRSEFAVRVHFTPDGETVVAAGMDKHLRAWDVASGELLLRQKLPREPSVAAFEGNRLSLMLIGQHDVWTYDLATLRDGEMEARNQSASVDKPRSFELGGGVLCVANRFEIELLGQDQQHLSAEYDMVRVSNEWIVGVSRWVRDEDSRVEIRRRGADDVVAWSFAIREPQHIVLLEDEAFIVAARTIVCVDLASGEATPILELDAMQRFDGDAKLRGRTLLVGAGQRLAEIDLDAPRLDLPTDLGDGDVAPGGKRLLSPADFGTVSDGDNYARDWALLDVTRLDAPLARLRAEDWCWSSDGSVLALRVGATLTYVDARTGDLLGSTTLPTKNQFWEPVLGSSTEIALRTDDANGDIVVVFDCGTNQERWRHEGRHVHLRGTRVAVGSRDGKWGIWDRSGEPRQVGAFETKGQVRVVDGGWIVGDETTRCFDDEGTLRWRPPSHGLPSFWRRTQTTSRCEATASSTC